MLPCEGVRVCRACSTETDDTGRFCPECGSDLVGDEANVASLGAAGTVNVRGSALVNAEALLGQTIDAFVIDDVLGAGQFGAVYRGRQLGLDRAVAIKVPSHTTAADPVLARRFQREARSAARVTHPGVVAIYGVGQLPDGRPYLAMQLIEGEPLDRVLAEGPLPVPRALGLLRLIASALAETHAAAVVHRDLKPSNIMWRRDRAGDDRITIVDFGIASVCRPGTADAARLTTNGLIGTPHYMSPEQAHGDQVDARADLYALGCILFELVTGQPPFEGAGVEVLLAHLGRPIPKPSDKNRAVPPVIDALVHDLMQKKPADRPQSADDVVARIDEALRELEAPPPRRGRPTTGIRTAHHDRVATSVPGPRWRLPAALAAVAAVSIVATAVVMRARTGPSAALAGGGQPDPAVVPDPAVPADSPTRKLVFDDGELTARVTVPAQLVAGARTRPEIEMWNALGAPLERKILVITIEDPQGKATGVNAERLAGAPGRFGFDHVFPAAGLYVVRVFPPESMSVFTIELDVEAR